MEAGHVTNLPRFGPLISENKTLNVLLSIEENFYKSFQEAGLNNKIGKSSVRRISELNEDDPIS